MGPYARAGLAGIVSCGVLFTAVLIGRPDGSGNDDNAKDERPQPEPYVALGDSYTSGPKIPRQSGTPAGCDRSDHNYPAVVARQLGVTAADFRDVSCSGATITDLTAAQKTSNGTNPAQLSALSTRTRLVTLGIGGNDIGFGSTVTKCITMGAMYRAIDSDRLFSDDAPCKKQYADGGTDEVAQKIQTSRPKALRGTGRDRTACAEGPGLRRRLSGDPARRRQGLRQGTAPRARRLDLPARQGEAAQHHAARAERGRRSDVRRHLLPVRRSRRLLRGEDPLDRAPPAQQPGRRRPPERSRREGHGRRRAPCDRRVNARRRQERSASEGLPVRPSLPHLVRRRHRCPKEEPRHHAHRSHRQRP